MARQFPSCNALKERIVIACIEHVIYLCINTQSASIGLSSRALLQQWLVRQDSSKASKGGKQNHGEAAKVWLELKSCAVQDLVAWQGAVITQDMLPSAADIRSACKVGHYHSDAACITAVTLYCTLYWAPRILISGASWPRPVVKYASCAICTSCYWRERLSDSMQAWLLKAGMAAASIVVLWSYCSARP